jgi:hypothetical protein
LVEAARSRGAQERLQLRKRELDRIEIRTVGWETLQPRAAMLDGRAHLRLFVRREIIEHDDIAWLKQGALQFRQRRIRLCARPVPTRRGEIRPALFVGVYGLPRKSFVR